MDEKLCWPCEEPVVEQLPGCPLQCKSPKCPSYKKRTPLPDLSKKIIIWVLGGPRSGKGTQCANIVKNYGFTHLSVRDLLRDEVKSGSERAQCLVSIMERGELKWQSAGHGYDDLWGKRMVEWSAIITTWQGELVPNDHVLDLLKKAMYAKAAESEGYLIDGFPREERQGVQFEKNIAPVSLVIYFEASDATLTQRLLAHAVTSGRADDNPDAIKIRLRTFHEHNRHVIEQYPHRLVTINAERTAEAIFVDVQQAIDEAIVEHQKKLEAIEAEKAKDEKACQLAQGTPSALEQFKTKM